MSVLNQSSPWGRRAIAILVLVVLLAEWTVSTNGSPIIRDGRQNLEIAHNFAAFNVFSLDSPDNPHKHGVTPTRYREPVPPFVIGVYLKALNLTSGPNSLDYLKNGIGARWVKLHNVIWGIILSLSVYAALKLLTGSFVFGAVGLLIAGLKMPMNTLYTEPASQALLALFSFLFMLAVTTLRPMYCALAGISLGALVLTKGIFLYVGFALAACFGALLAWYWLNGRANPRMATGFVLFLAGAMVIVAPWSARNYYYFGSAAITDRGGVVLLVRANQNHMTWQEFVGAIYIWAPRGGIKHAIGKSLGFTKADLNKGGKLQRLNRKIPEDLLAERGGSPDTAISYFHQARAERVKVRRALKMQGHLDPRSAGDTRLRQLALRRILERPFTHVLMSPLYLWRGAAFMALMLCLIGVLALRWRRYDLIIYMLPTAGMVAFLAFATHFIPRYSAPAMPIIVVLVMTLAHALLVRGGQKLQMQRRLV